jgi:dTDP-4-amino-4,6-dideoxygalactose transaminase
MTYDAAPVLPVLSWRALALKHASIPTVLHAKEVVPLKNGSAALALALRHARMEGCKALLPAFHCRSMVEPFLTAGSPVAYYRIREDASVDIPDIEKKLDRDTRILLVAHYFGFYQPMRQLRALCDANDVLLIEDCAHAFFGEHERKPVGWYGDYAIASARKFFPISDGGYLVSFRHSLRESNTARESWAADIKSAFDVLETACGYRRLRPLSWMLRPLLSIKARLRRNRPAHIIRASFLETSSAMPRTSEVLIRGSNQERIVTIRRRNFQRLATGLRGCKGIAPLFSALPATVVPYMFPLLIDDPATVFPRLKAKRVPIWRWEDLDHTGCDISRAYAHRLLQLPCHQELRESEIGWMIDVIRETASCAARKPS